MSTLDFWTEMDPQIANPLKRPIILLLYQAAKKIAPDVRIKYEKHYEACLRGEA